MLILYKIKITKSLCVMRWKSKTERELSVIKWKMEEGGQIRKQMVGKKEA